MNTQFVKMIDDKVGSIASNAARREAAIAIATDALAGNLTAKMAELTGIYANSNIEAKTGLRAQVEASLDAMAQKVGLTAYTDATALMLGESLANFHWEQHGHKYVARHNEHTKKMSAEHLKDAQAVMADIRSHEIGGTSAPAANLPMLDASAALMEIENRSRQYPSKKSKKH